MALSKTTPLVFPSLSNNQQIAVSLGIAVKVPLQNNYGDFSAIIVYREKATVFAPDPDSDDFLVNRFTINPANPLALLNANQAKTRPIGTNFQHPDFSPKNRCQQDVIPPSGFVCVRVPFDNDTLALNFLQIKFFPKHCVLPFLLVCIV